MKIQSRSKNKENPFIDCIIVTLGRGFLINFCIITMISLCLATYRKDYRIVRPYNMFR